MEQTKWKSALERIRGEKKLLMLVAAGILGILLLVGSELWQGGNTDKNPEPNFPESMSATKAFTEDLERRLSEMISQIDGAGKTAVMVTLESSSEKVYAQNENGKTKPSESDYSYEYIIIKDKASGEQGMLLRVGEPKIRGVIVVCAGGDKPIVQKAITDAVTAALGIGSNDLSISKMKITQED